MGKTGLQCRLESFFSKDRQSTRTGQADIQHIQERQAFSAERTDIKQRQAFKTDRTDRCSENIEQTGIQCKQDRHLAKTGIQPIQDYRWFSTVQIGRQAFSTQRTKQADRHWASMKTPLIRYKPKHRQTLRPDTFLMNLPPPPQPINFHPDISATKYMCRYLYIQYSAYLFILIIYGWMFLICTQF